MDIYEHIINAKKTGTPYAVATIVRTIGCSPRSAGTKMIVFADGHYEGTVGGGAVERGVIEDCITAIRSGQTALNIYSPETTGNDDCKKTVEIFIEPGDIQPHIYFLGAGHVAQAVLPYAKKLGYYNVVIDTRDTSEYSEFLKDADEIVKIDSFEDTEKLDFVPQSFIIICTYSHATDGIATCAVMGKNAAYIGMLGAKHKFVPIFNQLRALGYSEEAIREIYAPIGLDIGGESPAEIGISIMAEIMSVRYGTKVQHLRDKKRASIFGE